MVNANNPIVSWEVFDINGQQVECIARPKHEGHSNEVQKLEFDFSELKNGVYFLVLEILSVQQ